MSSCSLVGFTLVWQLTIIQHSKKQERKKSGVWRHGQRMTSSQQQQSCIVAALIRMQTENQDMKGTTEENQIQIKNSKKNDIEKYLHQQQAKVGRNRGKPHSHKPPANGVSQHKTVGSKILKALASLAGGRGGGQPSEATGAQYARTAFEFDVAYSAISRQNQIACVRK